MLDRILYRLFPPIPKDPEATPVSLLRLKLGVVNIEDVHPEPDQEIPRREFLQRLETSYADIVKILDCMKNEQVMATVQDGDHVEFGRGVINGIILVRDKFDGYHTEMQEIRKRANEKESTTPVGFPVINESPFPQDTI